MNPDWSRLYAPQPEIQAYIEHCAEKYDLTRRIHLNREIVSVIYNDQTGLWTTTFQDGEAVKSRFVINGSGGLHEPSIPAFNGLDQFQGTTMHTTRWDDDFDWAGKRVAVIGSAASAIQAIPQLAKTAAHVGIYQRTPNYIAPRDDYAYSADQQAAYAADPSSMIKDRETMFRDRDTQLYPIVVNKGVRDIAAQQIKGFIQSQVTDPVTQNALMPDYELGCKRILISDDYLPALNRDNVALITAPIDEITNTGIKTGDGETPYDAIVFATGFNLNAHQFALDLRGEKGRKLSVQWQDAATAYRSVMIPNFPNYFMSTGPNSGVGTTSVVFMIEQTVDWIMQAIKGAGAGSVSVTDAAAKTYNSAIQKDLSKTVWASGCQSWYLSDDGRIETLYPGNAVDFQNMMKHLDGNDLEFFSVSNGEKTMLVPELSTPKIAAKPELEICGTYDPAFAAVRDNFESNFHDHNEIGASVCLSIDGKTVVDLWAGHRDAAQTKPWEQNTIGVVFSCTKAATALCAHLLVDRGQLDLDAKVTTYWPEFTGGGKEHATVRMLLNHSVGLPAFRGPLKDGAYADWDYMVSLLESEEPFWEPGTKNGYHMVSFGWTVGEVIRRVSGKSLGTFFRDEIAGPLGLDFHIGTPASEHARMADVIPYVPDPTAPITPFVVALMTNTKSISHLALLNNGKFNANQSRYIEAEIGGAGGVANARSLVGMFTPLATKNGFLSDARIDTMRAVSMQSDLDETLLIPTRFGEGFMLSMDNTDLPVGNSMVIGEGAFGHVGMGGSVGFAHPESGLAFGYTMNNMGGGILLNERGQSLVNTACSLL